MSKTIPELKRLERRDLDVLLSYDNDKNFVVTYDDIKDRKDAWYADWTMTVAQDEEWKKWKGT